MIHRNILRISILAALLPLAACARLEPAPAGPGTQENHVRRSILPGRAEILLTEEAVQDFSPDEFIRKASSLGVLSVERVFPDAGEFEARHRAAGLHRWYRVRYDETLPATKAQAEFSSLEGVQAVDFPRRKERRAFNDPLFKYQWHYLNDGSLGKNFKQGIDINVEPVWNEFTAGSNDVIVAVVDGGIDLKHEDLKSAVLPAGDSGSRNFVAGDIPTRIPADDHGTHVAGTIGAVNNNNIGVCGIAGGKDGRGGVRLMSCAIFNEDSDDEDADSSDGEEDARALVWAADHGAVIANNSWGYVADSEEQAAQYARDFKNYASPTRDAIDYFIDHAGTDASGNQTGPMKGGVVFFAAGNDGWSHDAPSEYERVIAVGAFGPDGTMSLFSNYGPWVDILAPGGSDADEEDRANEWIASCGAGNEYYLMPGTSMACPHASGVAALLVSYFGGPGFTNEDLKEMLLGGARTGVIEIPRGRTAGGGMLDAYGAFTYKSGADPGKPDIRFSTDYDGDYRIKSHETVDIRYTISGNEKARLNVEVSSDCPGLSAKCSTGQANLHIEALQAQPGDYTAVIRVGNVASKQVPFTILENHAPVLEVPFDDMIVNAASDGFNSIDLTVHFSDPDGETPVYSVSVSNPDVISAWINGDVLSLSSEYGLSEMILTASDARGARCQVRIRVLGRNAYQDLDVYPNPVSDYLFVRPDSDVATSVVLYSRGGARVLSRTGQAGPFNPLEIDVRSLDAGSYTLQVTHGGKTTAKHIVKY